MILAGGLLVGAGFGAMGSIGRAWFILVAGAVTAPISLGTLTGAISYPPYPLPQSEAAGATMLVAMPTLWLLALPAPFRRRLTVEAPPTIRRRRDDRRHSDDQAGV